jgi:hypothetical protein
MMRSTV